MCTRVDYCTYTHTAGRQIVGSCRSVCILQPCCVRAYVAVNHLPGDVCCVCVCVFVVCRCPSASAVTPQVTQVKAAGDSWHNPLPYHNRRPGTQKVIRPGYQGSGDGGGGNDDFFYHQTPSSNYHPDYHSYDKDDQFDIRSVAASTCPADKVSFDLNGPSISGNVGGTLVVQRSLTAVCSGDGPVHFTALTSASPGSTFSISVWPQAVTLSELESTTVTVTVQATRGTPLNQYQFGQVRGQRRTVAVQ